MQYLDGKTTVTHIVASNLTPKKKVEFRRYRIVKPAWVVESVKAGTLLPWDNFRVVDEGRNQGILALDKGKVTSQVNTQSHGYKDQTNTSWYADEVKRLGHHQANQPAPNEALPLNFQAQDSIHDSESEDTYTRLSRVGQSERGKDGVVNENRSSDRSKSISPTNELEEFDQEYSGPLDGQPQLLEGRSSHDREQVSPSKRENLTAEEHNSILLSDPRMRKSSVLNPEFLQQYYAESRLHHLSKWKADLKSQLQQMAAEKSSQKPRQKRVPGSRRYIMHVDFDSFFAAVSLCKAPQFFDQPVVVAHGNGPGSEIASCNYPARKFGVKNGMWMKKALVMCPDLKVLPYDFPAYEEASRKFYETILDLGGIVQSVSVDEALVDMTAQCLAAAGSDGTAVDGDALSKEQAAADEMAQNLRDQVKIKTGCAISVGIGGNILQSKIALRRAKPAGQYQIKPDELLDFLAPLDVQDLPGVAYSIGGKLQEVGVKTVEQMRSLSKERLVSILGPKTGEKMWEYSRGLDNAEVGDQIVRKSVSAEVNWGVRFETQAQADEFVQSLCGELSRRLLKEALKGKHLTMKVMRRAVDAPLDPPKHLGHGKCDVFNKSVALGVATNAPDIIAREALIIIKGFNFSPGELRGLGIQMQKLEPVKPGADGADSSQKILQFKTSTPVKTIVKPVEDPIIDDIESPQKNRTLKPHPGAVSAGTDTEDDIIHRTPINTSGTQFILPTQVDPSVLAELPFDIRSKLKATKKDHPTNRGLASVKSIDPSIGTRSRSHSPASVSSTDALYSQVQLDPASLEALPEDVRAEVLAFYAHRRSTRSRPDQMLLPQSPRKSRTIPSAKKTTTSIKKRSIFGSRMKTNSVEGSDLKQSNFIANSLVPKKAGLEQSLPSEISEEFLEALPEDVRAEVVAEHRKSLLSSRSALAIPQPARRPQKLLQEAGMPHKLQLAPRGPRPYFTTRQLTTLAELRDATTAWVEEFQDDGPLDDDVEALLRYLSRVVLEERDMAKATSVVKWLHWSVHQVCYRCNEHPGWRRALATIEDGVQAAIRHRGLGPVEF